MFDEATEHRLGMTDFDYDAADRQFAEQMKEIGRREVMVEKLDIVRKVMGIVILDKNPLLACDAYKFATRQIKATEEELGSKYGVTKQAFSKRVKQWQQFLDLPPLGSMRSEKACKTFKEKTTESWTRRKNELNEAMLHNTAN